MKKTQFRGYILEHVLAYILKASGYSIIDKISRIEPDITKENNGLNITGRGAKHQIDVIGDLDWIPVFTFPTRLIIEAKFKSEKVRINIVREQIGILADINENYFSAKSNNPKPRYRYVSAIFSASGFTKPAIDLAVAHQIQLIDMSGDAFAVILKAINNFTDKIFGEQENLGKEGVLKIRKHMIKNFFNQGDCHVNDDISNLRKQISSFRNKVFIGMSQGGFMLLLHDKKGNFLDSARRLQVQDVNIHWNTSDDGQKWVINPTNGDKYELTFKLPQRLHDWIYKASKNIFTAALDEKQRQFSKISIYHQDADNISKIFILKFDKNNLKHLND